uniref:Death ligand signal enhancer n=1 Tax=Heterorhabditis bacteriophora TaxID=37862 RepID=A0A1I7X5D9_HETBA
MYSSYTVSIVKNNIMLLAALDISHDDIDRIVENSVRSPPPLSPGDEYLREKPFPNTKHDEHLETLYQQALKFLERGRGHGPEGKKAAYKLLDQASSLGHPDAMKLMGFAHMFGDRARWSLDEAKRLFLELSANGSPDAQLGLAFMYATGLGMGKSDQTKALVYYMFSALGGNPLAQMAMGYRYHAGIGVPVNCESALSYYQKAADKVAEGFRFSTGLMEPSSTTSVTTPMDQNLIEYYRFLAEKGDLAAQVCLVGLGQLYLTGGRGVEQNFELANKYSSIIFTSIYSYIYVVDSDIFQVLLYSIIYSICCFQFYFIFVQMLKYWFIRVMYTFFHYFYQNQLLQCYMNLESYHPSFGEFNWSKLGYLHNEYISCLACLNKTFIGTGAKMASLLPFTQIRANTVNFFMRRTTGELWKTVTSVSKSGMKKGRRSTRQPVRNLQRLHRMVSSPMKVKFPGYNTNWEEPGLSVIGQTEEEIQEGQIALRKELDRKSGNANKRFREKLHPLERGFSGTQLVGQKLGPPPPVDNVNFDDFQSYCLDVTLSERIFMLNAVILVFLPNVVLQGLVLHVIQDLSRFVKFVRLHWLIFILSSLKLCCKVIKKKVSSTGLHVVEMSPSRHFLPQIVASPISTTLREEDTLDAIDRLNLDDFYGEGRYPLRKPKQVPFFSNLDGHVDAEWRKHPFRNHEEVMIRLLADGVVPRWTREARRSWALDKHEKVIAGVEPIPFGIGLSKVVSKED